MCILILLGTADLPMTRPLPRDVMGAGVTITSVYKDSSYIPRASSMKVKASMFGYEFDVFEVSILIINVFT